LAVAPAQARPRAGGGRFLIIIGLLVAVAAGGGVFLYGTLFGGSGGGVLSGGTVVVVAAQAIPVRHQITDADLTTTKISPNLPNTYGQTKDVKGLISELFISKGALITSDMLARDVGLIPAGSAPAYLPLPSGWVAMTIPTGEQQGVAGHISLDDYITVVASASISIPPNPPKVVSKTIFTNVHIIGLGPAVANVQPASGGASAGGSQGTVSGITSSLTIELTQCDAEFFIWFLNNMSLRYTLESPDDYLKVPPTTDQTCATVQSAHGVSLKQVEDRYHFGTL
jgi:Flp pilus assembly protein CpaB